jgi:hypothetical protein
MSPSDRVFHTEGLEGGNRGSHGWSRSPAGVAVGKQSHKVTNRHSLWRIQTICLLKDKMYQYGNNVRVGIFVTPPPQAPIS